MKNTKTLFIISLVISLNLLLSACGGMMASFSNTPTAEATTAPTQVPTFTPAI